MVAASGGPADFVDRHECHLPRAPVVVPAEVERDAWVAARRPLALVHARTAGDAAETAAALRSAFELADTSPRPSGSAILASVLGNTAE